MPYVGIERRRFARVRSSLGAVLEGANDVVDALVENISLKGLKVRLMNQKDVSLPAGWVAVYLYPDTYEHCLLLGVQARVVRISENSMALQFRPMRLSDHTTLKALMTYISDGKGDIEAA